MNHRVVITGIGLVTSIGNDKASTIESLKNLKHGIRKFVFLNNPDLPVRVASIPSGFDVTSCDYDQWEFPATWKLSRETLRSLAPHGVYTLCSMIQAVEDAGLDRESVSNIETGLFTASAGSPMLMQNYLAKMHETRGRRNAPMGVVSTISGTLHFNLCSHFGIQGAACGFVSACTSSSHALGYAFDEITLGRQKRMFVAAGEEVTADSILPFSGMRALSTQADPDLASRPFDRLRDGFVAGGGGVTLCLEEESLARKRGAKIYGEMLGWGQASDGFHIAISHPDGDGLKRSIERALAATRIRRDQVDYINAHATSTPPGDLSEGRAIEAVFSGCKKQPPMSSTKALTGHGLSLAGVMEAAFCALAIDGGFIPGAANLREPDPAFSRLNLPLESLEIAPGIVLNNNSGFGGGNVTLVLSKYS